MNIIIDNNFSCVHLSLSIEDLVSPLGDVQSSAIVCGQEEMARVQFGQDLATLDLTTARLLYSQTLGERVLSLATPRIKS